MNKLRENGIKAEMDLLGRSLKAQMKYADKFNVKYTIILGDDEIAKGVACVRDMSDSSQHEVPLADVVSELVSKIK